MTQQLDQGNPIPQKQITPSVDCLLRALIMDHLDLAYSPATEKAKTIAGGCLAQARRGNTSGPKGCGQEVRN